MARRRRTDKAVEQLRAAANEVREEVAFTCSSLHTLSIPADIIQVLKDTAIARHNSEDLLDRILAEDPDNEDRARRIATLQESLADLNASEARFRRRVNLAIEIAEHGQIDG